MIETEVEVGVGVGLFRVGNTTLLLLVKAGNTTLAVPPELKVTGAVPVRVAETVVGAAF